MISDTNIFSKKSKIFKIITTTTTNTTTTTTTNNNNKRVYPNPRSGQRVLALIGWFEQAVILCGGTKAQKQLSHRSNSGCWTDVLATLIGRLCGTDPYSFMKEHVISIEEVSC